MEDLTKFKSINELLNELGGPFLSTCKVSPRSKETPYSVLLVPPDRKFLSSIAGSWYKYQKALMAAISLPSSQTLQKLLIKYHDQDKQFPPDILKTHRLFRLLKLLQPTHILELGCGTSSLVISSHVSESQDSNNKVLTLDNSEDWIKCTRSKVAKSLGSEVSNHKYLCHISDDQIISSCANFLAHSESLFIYLDAVVLDQEETQGLDLLIRLAELMPAKIYLLIDSRKQAYFNLHKLSKALNRNLNIITSVIFIEESNDFKEVAYLHPLACFQEMHSFTFAIAS